MRVLLVGGGSIGLLMAGRLARGPAEVHLVCRSSNQAEAVASGGITINGLDGTRQTVNLASVSAFDSAAAADSQPIASSWSWILLTVKQKDLTTQLIQWLSTQMGENTRLVGFQNGIGHMELLAETLPKSRLFAAVTTEGAKRESSTEVSQTGRGTIWLGRAFSDNKQTREHLMDEEETESLLQVLREVGIDARGERAMTTRIWNKLIVNAVINPLTAISEVKNGQLLNDSHRQSLARQLYREAKQVAASLDILTADDLWEQIEEVCRKTADNYSSMLQDRMERRKTEIDWINGSLLRLALMQGISVPAHENIFNQVKSLENQYLSDHFA